MPKGYRVAHHEVIAPGVGHVRLESARPPHVVEVGYVRPGSAHRVEVRHAGPHTAGADRRPARTSALCGSCAYATNGDYAWRPDGVVARPIGGIVERGVVLVSPDPRHQQASFTADGGFTTARVTWSARVTSGGRALTVTGKNVPRAPGALVLYTSDYVRSTGTVGGAELTLALPDRASNLRPGIATRAALLTFRDGSANAPAPPGTVVLSGSGARAAALRRLWQSGGRGTRVEITETLTPDNVWASVGAGHILVRNGRRWLAPENAPHITVAHPRTFSGVLRDGTLFHATVDGRDVNAGRSVGMPLPEAVSFLLALGAREAINLDGGGSTTFVRDGYVVNRPSDGAERAVTNAVVVVRGRLPRPPATPSARTVVARPRPELPETDPTPAAAYAPLAASGTPRAEVLVWVATGNVGALLTAFGVLWVRRGRPGIVAADEGGLHG